MRKRDEWFGRIREPEREYLVALAAATAFRDDVRRDPTLLSPPLRWQDLERMLENVEGTYFIRLYAVFEAGLREAWRVALHRDSQPPMRDLLNGFAATCVIPHRVLEATHRVREYRNTLVHERDEEPEESFTLMEGRHHLCEFFSRLPPEW